MSSPCPSSVYGPVNSWRMGRSLGVDLLLVDSICSFRCVYCQLGRINRVTTRRSVFVPTEMVVRDLKYSDWRTADVITFSGSGEPTLASNLGEAITAVRELTGKPVAVLTNSSLLTDPNVRREVSLADRIYCKLDAWSDGQLVRKDRPAEGITLQKIIDGIKSLRSEHAGFLAIQTMLLAEPSDRDITALARIIRRIGPDEVELNIPLRPIPERWTPESRGNLTEHGEPSRKLKPIGPAVIQTVAGHLREAAGVKVITPFSVNNAGRTNKNA